MASNLGRWIRVFVWAGLSVLVVIALAVAASHVPQVARALEVAWLPATLVVVVLALAAAVVAVWVRSYVGAGCVPRSLFPGGVGTRGGVRGGRQFVDVQRVHAAVGHIEATGGRIKRQKVDRRHPRGVGWELDVLFEGERHLQGISGTRR